MPAAPSLVKDPIVLSRAVGQAETFYKEILILPLPAKPLPAKVGAIGKKKVLTASKQEVLENQLNHLDEAIMNYYAL